MAPRSLALRLLVVSLSSTGCPEPRESREGAPQEESPAVEVPDRYKGVELAKIGPGIVQVDLVLGHSPEEVAKVLGEPKTFSEQPVSCVRFVPDRVFFTCKHEFAVYHAPENAAEQIEIEFEDGKARTLAIAGFDQEGSFDPERALELVGLDLPGTAKLKHPEYQDPRAQKEEAKVDLHSWWNGEARLLVDGQEHRVEVSVVNGDWRRAKVKILNNHPLDEDQTARIRKSKHTPEDSPPEGPGSEPD